MSVSIYDDLNPDWEEPELPGWEPWEPDEDVDVREGGCDYCGAPDVRDNPEPFGGKPCCDACFNLIIGGDVDDPPWRCGTPNLARSLGPSGDTAPLQVIAERSGGLGSAAEVCPPAGSLPPSASAPDASTSQQTKETRNG